jgi:hypothetical protein
VDYVDGCVWYEEITMADGSSTSFDDKPFHFRGYVHFPNAAWATSDNDPATGSPMSGGVGNPATASKVYCLIGLTSDPTNFPEPADIAGAGLEATTNATRMYRGLVKNGSTASATGNIGTNSAAMDNINVADVTAGHRSVNRVEFWFSCQPNETLTAAGIDVADAMKIDDLQWRGRYDNGDAYGNVNTYALNQRWGRSSNLTSKLYVWVAVGRGYSGAGSSQQLDFNAYYSIDGPLTSGTNPSGTTALPAV